MFRVTPRVLEGTRPLISSLYLPYSKIEGSKLAQAASGDHRSKDASHLAYSERFLLDMYYVLTLIPASVMRLQDAI